MDDDEMLEQRARERLRHTDLEGRGNLPGKHKIRLTEDGLNQLVDALSLEGLKFAKRG